MSLAVSRRIAELEVREKELRGMSSLLFRVGGGLCSPGALLLGLGGGPLFLILLLVGLLAIIGAGVSFVAECAAAEERRALELAERARRDPIQRRADPGHGVDLKITPRQGVAIRCAYCHDVFVRPVVPCQGCGATYHHSCRRELGGCATLGCVRARRTVRA